MTLIASPTRPTSNSSAREQERLPKEFKPVLTRPWRRLLLSLPVAALLVAGAHSQLERLLETLTGTVIVATDIGNARQPVPRQTGPTTTPSGTKPPTTPAPLTQPPTHPGIWAGLNSVNASNSLNISHWMVCPVRPSSPCVTMTAASSAPDPSSP